MSEYMEQNEKNNRENHGKKIFLGKCIVSFTVF